jgi:hypothetical protein
MADETENTATPEPTEPVVEQTPDEQAVAAFSEGAEAVTPKVEADAPVEPAKEAEPAKVEPVKEPTPEEKAATEAKAKVDAEVAQLNLKGKTAERFRELSARPTKEEVEKQIAPIKELAQQAEQFNEIIRDTRANAEQIGTAFRYLKAINSGDREAMRGALKSMSEEVAWLAKTLGEPVSGFDPVTQHKDLNDRVEAGEITADVARELAQARARQAADAAQREASTRQTKEQEEQQAAINESMQRINTLNERLRASDPHFSDKLKVLKENGTIDLIRENMHPSRWPAAVEAAYTKLPNPAPKTPVTPMPLRPSNTASMKRDPKNDLEAFSIGAESVR